MALESEKRLSPSCRSWDFPKIVAISPTLAHRSLLLFVKSPAGPLSVGEERPREITNLKTATGIVRLLSPTDCVKDRLTWWFHSGDRQCLEQAVAVAGVTTIDLAELRRWSVGEGKSAEFEIIAQRLKVL